jgi:hypothetical protein
MRALSIRQPYAELILRGIKTVEYRSRATRIIGERFYIYASKGAGKVAVWSEDLRVGTPPGWMVELAEQIRMIEPGAILPTGVIVGSAVIDYVTEIRDQRSDGGKLTSDFCPLTSSSQTSSPSSLTSDLRPLTSIYEWHLTDVKRAKKFRKPTGHPQPVWFRPF